MEPIIFKTVSIYAAKTNKNKDMNRKEDLFSETTTQPSQKKERKKKESDASSAVASFFSEIRSQLAL